jgi:hypothetical protein
MDVIAVNIYHGDERSAVLWSLSDVIVVGTVEVVVT